MCDYFFKNMQFIYKIRTTLTKNNYNFVNFRECFINDKIKKHDKF